MPSAYSACTLLADGLSDRTLIPLLKLLLDEHCPHSYNIEFANPQIPAGKRLLSQRIASALDLYPCDLLFVHRDAEKGTSAQRDAEIQVSIDELGEAPSHICVIPVRMTESWLLVDELAIRRAAGNPQGKMPLGLPVASRIESLPDSKETLFEALRTASGLPPQRLQRFQPEQARHRVSELVTELAALRRLSSFQHLEAQVKAFFERPER
jgi:hypothetical protein